MQLGRYSAEQCLRPAHYSPASLEARLKDMRDAPTEYHDGLTALGQAAGWLVADTDEAGHRSDLMSATGGLLPRIWVDDVSGGWIGQERVDFRAPNVAFAGFRR